MSTSSRRCGAMSLASPVVEDDDLDSGQFLHDLRIAPVAMSVAEFIKQPREATVLNREAVAADLVARRSSNLSFALTGASGNRRIEVFPDPLCFD